MNTVKIECKKCGYESTFTEPEFRKRLKKFMEPLGIAFVSALPQLQCIECWSTIEVEIYEKGVTS